MNTYRISFYDNSRTTVIEAVQGDTMRSFRFYPTDFTLIQGQSVNYYVKRPSGIPVYNTAFLNYNDNYIDVDLTAEALAEVGENNLQVRIMEGNDVLTSFEVVLLVREFGGIGAVESHPESNVFDQVIEQAMEYIAQVIDKTLSIENKAADAKATGDAIAAITVHFADANNDGNVVMSWDTE